MGPVATRQSRNSLGCVQSPERLLGWHVESIAQPPRLEATSVTTVKIILIGTGIILVAALLVVSGRAAKIPEQEATGRPGFRQRLPCLRGYGKPQQHID